MSDRKSRPVVVGVDGSQQSLRAVDWAAREASASGRALRVVHAFEWPMFNVPLGPPPGAPAWAGLANGARRIVDEALERARTLTADVSGEYIAGFPRPVLLSESTRAHLVVVGNRGLGGVGALIVGSTGVELAARARCPAVVVPDGEPRATGRIVVGVDGSEGSRTALAFALDTAARRAAEVHVLSARAEHAVQREPAFAHATTGPAVGDLDDHRARLHAFVSAERRHRPEVAVREIVAPDPPAEALVAASGEADMVVVGSRGRGGFTGLLLGSVSHQLLHHARCPVAVTHSAEHEENRP